MFGVILKRLALSLVLVLCVRQAIYNPVEADSESPDKVIELNFVFLHGMGGNPCTFQLMSDQIKDLIPAYIYRYQRMYPGTEIRVDTLSRCYPGYVGIATWAENVVDSINTRFSGKDNIILIGHSTGGKVALYAAARNTGNIADRVAAVVTINSPVRRLNQYYVPGGGPMEDYCRTTLLGSDQGVCNSLAVYDSSEDGLIVSQTKDWLAFVSSEEAPLSRQYDRSGVDVWPRNRDDGIVPLPAQFSDGADVVYYGEYGHSDVALLDEPSRLVADQILRYVFGDPIECSVPVRNGTLEHEADWLLGTDRWYDIVGGVVSSNGSILHKNHLYFQWQEWEDVVGDCSGDDIRAYSYVRLSSLPVLTSIQSAYWFSADDAGDCRLKIRSRMAPLMSVKVDWAVYQSGLLPSDTKRTFYDVEITEGTSLASIRHVAWLHDDDPCNPLIRIWSEAQSPFRWFKASWRIYQTEERTSYIMHRLN
ncbi:esterase/lipase family protein [Chloroflexota bacterium]